MTFTTVHGNQAMMEAAAAAKGDVKVLAVTVLTSLDRGDLDDLGFQCDVETAGALARPARARRPDATAWWPRRWRRRRLRRSWTGGCWW